MRPGSSPGMGTRLCISLIQAFYERRTKVMPTIDMQATGENIRTIMQAKHIAVVDVQAVFGFNTPQAIYKWRKGTALPTIDNMIVLAALFNMKIDDIVVVTKSA